MTSSTRVATEYDRYIGQRICEARLAGKMSQKQLAELVGTSYQQVQKYESGTNRVTAARIERFGTALNRPLSYFFPNATDVRAAPLYSSFLASKDGQKLAAQFPLLSASSRRVVLDLVALLAKEAER